MIFSVLVPTTLLALIASTCANPVQYTVGQSPTPWTNDSSPAVYGCDGLDTAAFSSGYKPKLVRLEGGTNACAYQFMPGWPWKTGGSVGKTLKSGGSFKDGPGTEVDNLDQIKELHAHEKDVLDRDWVVMKAQPGKWLSKTQNYDEVAKKLNEATNICRDFYKSVYTAVYLDAKKYISDFGCIHPGEAEMGEGNVLIEFNAGKPIAHLVDWAGADCSPNNKPSAKAHARNLCADYAGSSAGPVGDCGGKFTFQQARQFCADLNL